MQENSAPLPGLKNMQLSTHEITEINKNTPPPKKSSLRQNLTLTKTCQTFSLAPSKLQKRMLTPRSPWPPHMLLGVTVVSRTASVLLLYNNILTGFSTFIFSSSFRVSLSLFCKETSISKWFLGISVTNTDLTGNSPAECRRLRW